MFGKQVIEISRVPDSLLSRLENRDIALWIQSLPKDPAAQAATVAFLGVPWRLVLSETYDSKLFGALEAATTFTDPMTRRRGFVQIIDSDPSRVELPQRCLPIYLLNGRQVSGARTDFSSQLRRITMLEELRRSGVREILVLSGDGEPVRWRR